MVHRQEQGLNWRPLSSKLAEFGSYYQDCNISPTLFEIIIRTALLNWKRKCSGIGVPIGDGSQDTILLFAHDQVLIAQEYEDMGFMVRKVLEEYEKWGLKINLEKLPRWVVEQKTNWKITKFALEDLQNLYLGV